MTYILGNRFLRSDPNIYDANVLAYALLLHYTFLLLGVRFDFFFIAQIKPKMFFIKLMGDNNF